MKRLFPAGAGGYQGPWLLFLSTLALIIYGSLYPFTLQPRSLPHSIPDTLLASLAQHPSRGDMVANVLLYIPFGLFLPLAFPTRIRAIARAIGATVAGLAVSMAIEIVQMYDVGRVPSLYDVATNTIGAATGALAAALGHPVLALPSGITLADPAAAVFAVSWLGYRLAPFVPTLDFQALKDRVKPLVLSPTLTGRDVLRHLVSWLLFAALADAALERHRCLPALLLAFVGIEVARLFLLGARIVPAEIIGEALACLLWALPGGGTRGGLALLACLTVVVLLMEGLAPFTFHPTPASFHCIPFYGFLDGAIEVNVQSLLQKLFLYGGLVWALARLGWNRLAAGSAVAVLLLAIELAQRHLPGRIAEITDPLIALGAMVVLMACVPRAGGWAPHAGDRRESQAMSMAPYHLEKS